jgi:hypothetical protein
VARADLVVLAAPEQVVPVLAAQGAARAPKETGHGVRNDRF